MLTIVNVRISPEEASSPLAVAKAAAKVAGIRQKDINDLRIVRKSVDARKKQVVLNLGVAIATGDDESLMPIYNPVEFKPVSDKSKKIIIVGAGPCGLFAALRALELGLKPIVIERGKKVEERRLDLADISRKGIVDPDSNYCFGEGGAGAFSDGKLFTRSKKRGNNREVLQLLHQFGAKDDILIDSHPHIGSDRLPKIISNIREAIFKNKGEILFQTRVTDILLNEIGECIGVETNKGEKIYGNVILATGHSSRDIYDILRKNRIRMESKGFAMGVRLEHPQELIDQLQYHSERGRGEFLPAAEYSFVTQVNGRGVYSFCMCPGGVVVPASSAPGELVVNGMSSSARAGKKSNSGMVVELHPGDFPEFIKDGEFDLYEAQKSLEKIFFKNSGDSLRAPAQRMCDFVKGLKSKDLPDSTYLPGIYSERLDLLLPPNIGERLKKGFIEFNRKCKGFLTNEAILIGLESRTSSPLRIPRDSVTLQHPDVKGLYPAGEGAGFAGGIVSAALDGRRCVDAIYNYGD